MIKHITAAVEPGAVFRAVLFITTAVVAFSLGRPDQIGWIILGMGLEAAATAINRALTVGE